LEGLFVTLQNNICSPPDPIPAAFSASSVESPQVLATGPLTVPITAPLPAPQQLADPDRAPARDLPAAPAAPPFRLILGSSSPYRRELLMRLRLPFDVISPDIDESPTAGEAPEATAMRLARQKAEAIAVHAVGALVIGSDQVATLDGRQIGKPGNHANALEQLKTMGGRRVVFHTAICLLDLRARGDDGDGATGPRLQVDNVQTCVTFRKLPEAELDSYLRIEQPYDCAGSAKNESLGIALIEQIESTDPSALTGLPLIALVSMLRNVGVNLLGNTTATQQ
jgi:septum formation protein